MRQVALARQIAQSAKEFAEWRRRRERELATLRRDGVRQQAQVRPPPPLAALSVREGQTLRAAFLFMHVKLCRGVRAADAGAWHTPMR